MANMLMSYNQGVDKWGNALQCTLRQQESGSLASMSYTIENFWLPRLAGILRPPSKRILPGWTTDLTPNPYFVEAETTLRAEHNHLDVPIWFVAAPGAVGKSTLAKEISARTGAVYLDLARAETVAGNYLTGGLVKNNLLALWQKNQTTVLIDALDEARLRVTQGSFEDFLSDVEGLSHGRTVPVVFFGRVGLIEETWLVLSEEDLNCPIFDIDFFDLPRAERFVMASLERLAREDRYHHLASGLRSHKTVYESASAAFVKGLKDVSAPDGARFVGYAPVLEAVAVVLAGAGNPAALNDSVQRTMQGQVIQQLAGQILEREAKKLQDQLASVPERVREKLYAPKEQLDRLTGIILGTADGVVLPSGLTPQQMADYDTAVKSFMSQHPFLDGTGHRPSGAVFAAVIDVHGLLSSSRTTASAAERHAGYGPHTPNPFLVDFYLDQAISKWGENPVIPPEHLVILYESIQARAGTSEVVRLTIEGNEETDDADVEIQINPPGIQTPVRRILLRTTQAGVLRFGRQVNGVSVDAPDLDIIIGSGNPVEIVAPVSLNMARLTFDCPELVVRLGDQTTAGDDSAVTIEALELLESKVVRAPLVRKGAELSVSWPGASAYPWTHFVGSPGGVEERDIDPQLRGLRRLVMAFRSHGKARLARFRDKIEHARITKGKLGVTIRQRLMQDGVITREGDMYFLDPTALGRIVGATYQDLKLKRFNDRVRHYASSIS